jgi:hypothetical protein
MAMVAGTILIRHISASIFKISEFGVRSICDKRLFMS